MDPSGFRDAKKKYDRGDPRKLIALMQRAQVDSHVSGCLVGRRSGFKRNYSIVSYEDTDTDHDRREWIQGVLERLQLRDLLEEIHEARLFMYAVIDFEWEIAEGQQVPIAFESFDQKYFAYDKERVLKIDFGRELREIPDTALVVEQRKRKMPLMMPVLRDFILKDFGVSAWSAFLENWGEPFIMGKYPAGSDDAFKKQVETAVNNIASSSRGIGPEGTEIEINEVQRRTGDHETYVEAANKGISISLLGHANAVQQSAGLQVGENMSAYEVRFDVAVDDMAWIEPHVNALIQTIWARNYPDARYPRFELSKAKPVKAKEHAGIVDMAWRQGLPIHPDEYRKLGLHVSADQEPLVRAPRATDTLFD